MKPIISHLSEERIFSPANQSMEKHLQTQHKYFPAGNVLSNFIPLNLDHYVSTEQLYW